MSGNAVVNHVTETLFHPLRLFLRLDHLPQVERPDHDSAARRHWTVSIHTLPRAHGDHFHVGRAVVPVHDATGLGNPSVLNALARKGLVLAGPSGLPVLTAEGLAYHTGIAANILHGGDH